MERLPPEILESIYQHLPTSQEGVRTLVALLSCHSFLAETARSNVAWEPQLQRWKYSSTTAKRGDHSAYEWYAIRAKIDRQASHRISALIEGTHDRLPAVQQLIEPDLAILDQLVHISEIDRTKDPHNYLARKYWATKAAETVSRRYAMGVWTRMAEGGFEDPQEAFEEGALAFSLFRGQHVGQTKSLLDRLLRASPEILRLWTEHPPSLVEVSEYAYAHLTELGIRSATGGDFHRIDNHYTHLAISDTSHGTLPMTFVILFTSFIRRLPKSLGLVGYPVGFPGTMMAGISRGEESIYFDPFNGGRVLQRSDLERMAEERGFAASDELFEPADPVSMCRRIAQNITTSMQVQQSSEDSSNSLYALATAQFFLVLPFISTTLPRQNSHLIFGGWMAAMIRQSFPFDLASFEELVLSHLPPGDSVDNIRRGCETMRLNDSTPIERKDLGTERIPWNVGDIFEHRRYHYVGVIMGVDATCEAEEDWIRSMRIDSLPRGRNQPFFNVAVEDGSTRYVAMKNLEPFDCLPEDASRREAIERAHGDLGRKFRRLALDVVHQYFEPTPELVAMYGPERAGRGSREIC